VDGVMLRYNRPLSDWQAGLTAHAGRVKLARPLYRYENHPNAALALSLSDNNWLFRISTLVAKTDYQAPAAQAVADLITHKIRKPVPITRPARWAGSITATPVSVMSSIRG
jgi:hypothetical protein